MNMSSSKIFFFLFFFVCKSGFSQKDETKYCLKIDKFNLKLSYEIKKDSLEKFDHYIKVDYKKGKIHHIALFTDEGIKQIDSEVFYFGDSLYYYPYSEEKKIFYCDSTGTKQCIFTHYYVGIVDMKHKISAEIFMIFKNKKFDQSRFMKEFGNYDEFTHVQKFIRTDSSFVALDLIKDSNVRSWKDLSKLLIKANYDSLSYPLFGEERVTTLHYKNKKTVFSYQRFNFNYGNRTLTESTDSMILTGVDWFLQNFECPEIYYMKKKW
jgi:hypothetical protein